MIQDIAPHTYDPVFRRKKPEDRDYLLHYEYNKVMLLKSGRRSVIPTFGGNWRRKEIFRHRPSTCFPLMTGPITV